MRLKSSIFALTAAIVALTGTGAASAQDYSFGWNPRSGDVWVDSQLNDVNLYGSRYREPFVNEMVRYYGAPRDLVTDLLVNRNWAPGDVYYACSIAQVIGRPCRYVVQEWDRDHGQGWGNVAQRMGIKPGSAEFHRLKRGFVPTYDRWARPIRIDEDLSTYFPNRGKSGPLRDSGPGKSANAGKGNSGQGAAARGGSGKPQPGNQRPAQGAKGGNANPGQGNSADKGKGNNAGQGNSGDKGKGNDKGGKGDGKG